MAADYSNAFIGASYGLEAVGQVGQAWAQSQALQAQGQFQQKMAEINQQFANQRANQVERQGDEQATMIRQKGVLTQGAQRAAAASQGVRVDDGSAADAVDSTRELSADDQITARNNAWREAFGIRTQAAIAVSQAQFQKKANDNAAQGTLLGGLLGGAATGIKATGYGLKAYRDLHPKTPDVAQKTPALTRPGADNHYFTSIFGDDFKFKSTVGDD